MASVEMTQLRIETVVLIALMLLYGTDRMSGETAMVLLLFVIASMLSMLKYDMRRGET